MATENKHVGDALLKLDAATTETAASTRRKMETILRRDRRRIVFLAGLAILFSVLAAAAFYTQFFLLFYVHLPEIGGGVAHHIQLDHKVDPHYIAGDHIEKEIKPHTWQLTHSNSLRRWMGVVSAAGLLLAALATVCLIFTSRRAALRQVNASLLEISHQLTQLQQALKKESPPESG
jgi:hypothetical protein